ncbi:MAG: M23 family metallopeptidase [Rhodothermales bacterium]|nr:M23 family metallopeptidase [Rhodothermales bacterium]MBO6781651.1 M23 family metallopeptidase [Rhodothermales bacterium]
MRTLFLLLLTIFVPTWEADPDDYPKDYFRSPLGIPISLSGNFAEMRSNHFHAGLDIRTNAQVGYRVYAAAEGTLVRVAVQGGGYGHALYLQHPNGYQTVYAHLDRFEEPIASWVRERQYAEQSFSVNLFPRAGQFRFNKGDVIGYSGNTGSSGGPHLHFEIRDAATSEPLNPLFFGLPVEDTTRPRAFRVKVYPSEPTAGAAIVSASGDTLATARRDRPASMTVTETEPGLYELDRGAHIVADGRVAFGIQTHDYHDRSRMRLGLYTITLTAGQREIFHSAMERINFSDQRYINAHLDYAERRQNSRWLQRSHILPGNRLNLYRTERNGFIDVRPGDRLPMRYDLVDAHGNNAVVTFDVRGARLPDPPPPQREGFLANRNRAETIVQPGLIVRIPRGALYEDTELLYSRGEGPNGSFSARHNLHRGSTPLHRSITVSVEAQDLPEGLHDKALLARVSGDRLISAGGSYHAGYVTTQTRAFGSFVITADTEDPVIEPLNIRDGADMSRQSAIRIRIRDGLSGIASYQGRVNGQWVLFEHDPKRSLIYYTFDDRVGPGSHELSLYVEDGKGNASRYSAQFTR